MRLVEELVHIVQILTFHIAREHAVVDFGVDFRIALIPHGAAEPRIFDAVNIPVGVNSIQLDFHLKSACLSAHFTER